MSLSTLWILSEVYYPEQTSTGRVLTQLAERLGTSHRVKVITGPPTNSFRRVIAPRRETRNGVEVFRRWGTCFNKDFVPGRLLNMITRSATIVLAGLRRCRKDDVILVVTNPPLLPYVAWLIEFCRGSKLILLIHDLYPDVLAPAGMVTQDSAVSRLLRRLSSFIYARAAAIIAVGRDMMERLRSRVASESIPIVMIPTWGEPDLVSPKPRHANLLLNSLGISDKFVVLSAGNMGRVQPVEDLAMAAERLRNFDNIHFIFLGEGSKKQWLRQFVSERGLRNVTILDGHPREDQINFLNACDIAFVGLVNGMKGVSVPSRLYNQMLAGKPIAAMVEEGSEIARVVEEEGIGWVIPPGNVEGLAKVLEEAARHPSRLVQMGQKAYQAACSKYTLEAVANLYLDLLRQLRFTSIPG